MVIHARIVLACAAGRTNAGIAADSGMHIDNVRKWRSRFYHHRLEGLADLPRSGRPPVFTAVQVAEVKQLAWHLARRHRHTIVAVVQPGVGHRSHPTRHHRIDIRIDGAAVAQQ